MTKEAFNCKQRALIRFGLTIVWLYFISFGVVFLFLWPYLATGKIGDMRWTSPAYQICMIACLLASLPVAILTQVCYAQRIGFACPHCGKAFWRKPVARAVVSTGICDHCKGKVIDDTHISTHR